MPSQISPIYPQGMMFWTPLYKFTRYEFYGSGVNTWAKPPAQNPEFFEQLTNVFAGFDVIRRRWGYSSFATPGYDARRLYLYQNDITGARKIIASSVNGINAYNEDGTLYAQSLFSTTGFVAPARMVNSRSYAYFATGNATQYKWAGTVSSGVTPSGITNWGIVAPVTALTVGAPINSGSITLNMGRKYFVVYRNSTTGHLSDLSPVSASTGPLTAQNVPLSNIPVSSDAQVDRKVILATLDGGDETTLYFLADIANATTTLTDNIADTTLAGNNVYSYIDDAGLQHGCVFNTPPPQGTVPIKHKGRLWMVYGQKLAMSKSLDEVTTSTGTVAGNYEEAWPAAWQIDISEGSETPRALLSDGTVLYIGDERRIRTLTGDNLLNWDKPEIQFNDVGVLNQETWQRVFMEGQPVGSIWVTPDFRVIQSDFNTYKDIGADIQDQLLTINQSNASKSCAMSVSDGEYDLYILAVPTGSNTEPNTLFVYNLRTQTWCVWTLADPVVGMLYNITASGAIQKLFASVGTYQNIWQLDRSYTQDRVGVAATNITSTIRTSWLSLGEPKFRKMLNYLEVLTGDTTMTVTIEGATNVSEFASPVTIVSGAPLTQGVFGSNWKVFLAGKTSKNMFYRITFTSTSTQFQVLNGFHLEYVQLQI
jgi:hypothetical protein